MEEEEVTVTYADIDNAARITALEEAVEDLLKSFKALTENWGSDGEDPNFAHRPAWMVAKIKKYEALLAAS